MALALLCFGCGRSEPEIPYERIELTSEKAVGGSNAFETYCRLAERAHRTSSVSLDARPTPGNRKKDLREMRPLLDDLSRAVSLPCRFVYRPVFPFERAPYREGWLRLSRSLVWQIESDVEAGSFGPASRWLVVATVFGVDLCGGTFSDASLGLETIDRARAAFAAHVQSLQVGELGALSTGIAHALVRMADAQTTIGHESMQMLAAVKLIQDAHKDRKVTKLAEEFYGRSRKSLLATAEFDDARRSEFFKALLHEQSSVVEQLSMRAAEPGSARGGVAIGLSGDERAIAEQFFYGGDAWLRARDRTIARTRLLALTAGLETIIKSGGGAPVGLGRFSPSLRHDPYTGRELGYISLGKDFIVYSFGPDGKDDRGDTDSKRLEPDLRLEEAPL